MKNDKLTLAIGEIDADLIERADENRAIEKRTRRVYIKWGAAAAAALTVTALILSVGAFNKKAPDNVPDIPESTATNVPDEGNKTGGETVYNSANVPETTDNADTERNIGDKIGIIVVGGEKYIQVGTGADHGYTLAEKLGTASSFEGTYKSGDLYVDGDVYSVYEDENVLVIVLNNGGEVILEKRPGTYEAGPEFILKPNSKIEVTGEEITDTAAAEHFNESFASVVSSLRASGVDAEEITISTKGFCRFYGGEGSTFELRRDFRDYLVFGDGKLIGIITLTKGDGVLHDNLAFGGDWYGAFDALLKSHTGEGMIFINSNNSEAVITSSGAVFVPVYTSEGAFEEFEERNIEDIVSDRADLEAFFGVREAVYTP